MCPVYQFTCPAGHTAEKRVTNYDVQAVVCTCGAMAHRGQVNRIGISGFARTPAAALDFSQDYRRFREASEGIDDQASTVERNEGVTLSSPLFKEAKKLAAVAQLKGVQPDEL